MPKPKNTSPSERRSPRRERRAALRAAERLCAAGPEVFWAIDAESRVDLAAAAGEGEADAPRFSMTAYNGGRLHVKNFAHPIVVDLAGLEARRSQYPTHLDHKQDQRVGHTDAVAIGGGRITAQGPISFESDAAREVVAAARKGFQWQASIGLRLIPSKTEFVAAGRNVKVNGREFTGPLLIARQSILNEISFVSVGGDEDGAIARIAAQSGDPNAEGAADMTFEQWLASKGFDTATLSEEQMATLKLAFESETAAAAAGDTDPEKDGANAAGETDTNSEQEGANASGRNDLNASGRNDLAAERAARAAEVERCRRIASMCAEHHHPTMRVNNQDVSIEAHAIASAWTLDRTQLELLRQSRGSAAVHSHSHAQACTLEAMQGAAIAAAGVPLDHQAFQTAGAVALRLPEWLRRPVDDARRARIMEAAHRFSQMSSLDVCREAIRLDGRHVPSGRQDVIEAAFSGGNLLHIWTTNVNAQLLSKFAESPDTTRGWVREADVADFRENERIRIRKGAALTKHARGKSADHHSGSDTKESYRIARYSGQYFVDEMDVIDDRLMAINDVIEEMALACARLRPDLVYAILLGNPEMADGVALFHTSRTNLDEDGAVMDATHIGEAITRMAKMREGGVNLNLTPTHLVTAATLRFSAQQALNSAEVREPAATGGGTKNPLQGVIANLLHDARIDNGLIDPDSGTAIAGDPTAFFVISTDGPTIEVGFLRGTGRAPKVTTWKKSGEDGVWGMGAAVNMDVGAKAIAFQTMQKLTA